MGLCTADLKRHVSAWEWESIVASPEIHISLSAKSEKMLPNTDFNIL